VLLIPVSFAFSILKYQAMNIDVVINRSLVYSLLTAFILGIYLLVAGFLGDLLHGLTGYEGNLFPILATLAAALAFTPAKNRIRVLVDKTFYRVRYDYRKAIRQFTQQVDLALPQNELVGLLLERIDLLLAVDRALLFLKREESDEFETAGSIGFPDEALLELERKKEDLLLPLRESREIRGAVGSTAFKEFPVLSENEVLKRHEIQLSFPMTEKEEILGLLLTGRKKSEVRYSAEDVELVSLMGQEVARALQSIRMRQRIMAEQLEKEKLQELGKLKTKFISNVSHDLRTPLTAIRFSLDNMLKGVYGDVPQENRKHLQMIQDNTLHVSRTIDNLLTLTMSESGRMVLNKEKLALTAVVDEACGMLRTLAERKGIELVQENLKDVFVHADKHSLLEILLNLLDNGIKYTDGGGKVSVSARQAEGGGLVEVSVRDNGVGIPPHELERIFERFHKVTPGGTVGEKGTGIGLDIVKNLVHLHGGQVRVESSVSGKDKGTRFSFTLPQG
jgi:signal transduction histidine kinase